MPGQAAPKQNKTVEINYHYRLNTPERVVEVLKDAYSFYLSLEEGEQSIRDQIQKLADESLKYRQAQREITEEARDLAILYLCHTGRVFGT